MKVKTLKRVKKDHGTIKWVNIGQELSAPRKYYYQIAWKQAKESMWFGVFDTLAEAEKDGSKWFELMTNK